MMLSTLFVAALGIVSQQPSMVTQQVNEISGIVDRVDRAGRTVTVRSADGLQTPIYAGPDLPVFDQLATGDRVTIRFYDSYIVETTPGAQMKPVQDTTAAAQKAHDTDSTSVLQQLQLVVTIDEIDRRNNTVTYHDVTKRRVLRGVERPQLLEELKVGDVITITYTRARAASIEKR
jgi:hypothetical protein